MIASTILIVEDDSTMLRGLKDNFVARGYRVEAADDGQAGLEAALASKPPDLILLDIMLPKVNGYEICRVLRERGLQMPIIMLTAKGQEEDIIRGLNLGADDYVTKPFSIRELLARVQAFLRRCQMAATDQHRFGDCRLDLAAHKLFRSGSEVPLTTKEFRMLEYFVRRPGRALTRHDILDAVWGSSVIVTARSVDRCVTTLRGKIEPDPKHPLYIRTIRDVGYRFEDNLSAQVTTAQPASTGVSERDLAQELDAANHVQRGFLPTAAPEIEGYQFFDFYQPARQLGGDYYDYVRLPGGRVAVVIADVMGKGIPASLVMAKLSAEARYCLANTATPAAAVGCLNHALCGNSWGGRFVTLVLAVLDPTAHQVTLVNGGHPTPLLRRRGGQPESDMAVETQLPLGIQAAVTYPQTTIALRPGDCMLLYTDGVPEAANAEGALYGLNRLQALLSQPLRGPTAIGRRICDDVQQFVAGQPPSDDICVVCFGRTDPRNVT